MAAPTYRHEEREFDLVVVGGGMAGITAAVCAARRGARVALVHDRPVLGGNGSSEIRVNLEGANGGAHARFFVESGLAEDLLLENLWRNPTGSADHWSAVLLDLVYGVEGLELFLDTHVHAVEVDDDRMLRWVRAITLASERTWRLSGRIFVDSTGDGTVAYLAGAGFMRGEENRGVYGEPLAPIDETDAKLGGTMWFMCKDVGRPVEFVRPAFAREVSADELRVHRTADVWDQDPVLGGFWWMEYGGALDTITDNEEIKRVLLSEVYGVWDYVKNAPELRDRNRNLDLEWVAAMPGKRESRRFVGDYVLRENDLMTATRFDDAVAFGGWSIDRHPPGGFLDYNEPPSVHVYTPGVYQIPLRSLYSRDVGNLLLAGRDVSCSHVASCSARVQLTCMSIGQAVGTAAARCIVGACLPRGIAQDPSAVRALQDDLQRDGAYVPHLPIAVDRPPADTLVSCSSCATLEQPDVASVVPLAVPRMLSLPLSETRLEALSLWVATAEGTSLEWRLFAGDADGFWIPGPELARGAIEVGPQPDGAWVEVPIDVELAGGPGYVHFAVASADADATIGVSAARPLGPLSWRSRSGLDARAEDRRAELGWRNPHHSYVVSYWSRADHYWGGPPGPSIAFRLRPRQPVAPASAVLEPWERPTVSGVHAWVSERAGGHEHDGAFVFDEPQWLELAFSEPLDASWVELYLNSDVDRHLANLWYAYPPGFRAMTPIVRDLSVEGRTANGAWSTLAEITENHLRRVRIAVYSPITGLRVTCRATCGERYASIVDLRIGR